MAREKSTRHKPPELTEAQLSSENGKKFVRDVKLMSKGLLYVYQWKVELSDAAPLGLFVEPHNTAKVCQNLEDAGAKRTEIQFGTKFDIATVSGFQGAHLEVYSSGKINVQWPRVGKEKKSPDFIDCFVDVIEIMSIGLSSSQINAKSANEKKTAKNNANEKTDDDDDDFQAENDI